MKNSYGIEMIVVSSSNVKAVGYDKATQTLFVSFLNGSLYNYKGVEYSKFEGLVNADSVGSYLHRNIKNLYQYNRIE